jgi:hypothetical protein
VVPIGCARSGMPIPSLPSARIWRTSEVMDTEMSRSGCNPGKSATRTDFSVVTKFFGHENLLLSCRLICQVGESAPCLVGYE